SPAMIGDRGDIDVVAGMQAGHRGYLVLSGSPETQEAEQLPFRPNEIRDDLPSIARRLTSAPVTQAQARALASPGIALHTEAQADISSIVRRLASARETHEQAQE